MSQQGLHDAIKRNSPEDTVAEVASYEEDRLFGGPNKSSSPPFLDLLFQDDDADNYVAGEVAGYYAAHVIAHYGAHRVAPFLGEANWRRLNAEAQTPKQVLVQRISESTRQQNDATLDEKDAALLVTLEQKLADKKELNHILELYQLFLTDPCYGIKIIDRMIQEITKPNQSVGKLYTQLEKLIDTLSVFAQKLDQLVTKYPPFDLYLQEKLADVLPNFIDKAAETATSTLRAACSAVNELIVASPLYTVAYRIDAQRCHSHAREVINTLALIISPQRAENYRNKLASMHATVQDPHLRPQSSAVQSAAPLGNVSFRGPTSAFDHRMPRLGITKVRAPAPQPTFASTNKFKLV